MHDRFKGQKVIVNGHELTGFVEEERPVEYPRRVEPTEATLHTGGRARLKTPNALKAVTGPAVATYDGKVLEVTVPVLVETRPTDVAECGCPKCDAYAMDDIANLCESCHDVYGCSEEHSRCGGDTANPWSGT